MRVRHWEHLTGTMGVTAHGLGRWLAPAALIEAPNGFSEELWLPEIPETVLAVRIFGAKVRRCFGAGGESGPGRNFALQPAGTPNAFLSPGAIRFGHVLLSPELIDRAAECRGCGRVSGRLRDDLMFVACPTVEQATRLYLTRAFDRAAPPSMLEMEARALLLLDVLLALHLSVRVPARGGLASWQERRATEYLSDNLAEDVSLETLAGVAGLSTFHFARQFKRSTGVPPHAFLRRLRCEKAKELLANTDLSIGEIGATVGYETPQAFARMFRVEVGVSPSEYRLGWRS